MRIVQISDIHFGRENVKGKVENAIKQINKIEPDLVIVTGDLTTWGLHPEFREAYEALLNLKSDMIVIPGNHDSRNSGSKFFELYFGKSRKHLVIDDFVIVAADSTQPDRDEGYIGAWQRRWIEKKFRKDKVNILALHHHIVPIPNTGRETNVLTDAGEIVETLIKSSGAVVLCGHRHMPYSLKLMRTHIIHAGTLGSFKILAMPDNNYNIIDLTPEYIELKLRFVGLGEINIGKFMIKQETPESVSIYHRLHKPKKVLFISERNDCRTLIAEAIFNKVSPKNMLALSGGVNPSDNVDIKALEILRQMGVKNRKPRKIETFEGLDYIISFNPEINSGNVFWDIPEPRDTYECKNVVRILHRKIHSLVSEIIKGNYNIS